MMTMVIIMILMTRMIKMECGDLGPSGEVTPVVDDCEDGSGVSSTNGLKR